MAKPIKPAGPVPDQTRLRDAALRHLSRFASTEISLARVLQRKLQRWAARARSEGIELGDDLEQSRKAVGVVVAELVASGVLNDGAYASARARRLVLAGRSQRAISAHLASRGVRSLDIDQALQGCGDELASALSYARRRRIGPFRAGDQSDTRLRDLGALARAGFPRAVAERALDMDADSAEALVIAARRSDREV